MASGRWRAARPLNAAISEQFGSFNVFQLMKLLMLGAPEARRSANKRFRFRAELGAGFQGGEISALELPDAPTGRITLHTPNYCIASELGPLPAPFLDWIREEERLRVHDHLPREADQGTGVVSMRKEHSAMAAFLNVFNQRVHVLRFELKQRCVRALDSQAPEVSRYGAQLAALMGIALPGQEAQIPLPRRAWLGMAGLLVNGRRSADVVSQIMSRYLGVPVQLEMLVGDWRNIEDSDRISLGRCAQRLGQSTLLGQRMWDCQASVRMVVGCLSFDRVLPLLPISTGKASQHDALVSLVHLLLDRRQDCEVQLAIDTRSIPPSRLVHTDGSVGLRLGQTAWLTRGAWRRARATHQRLSFRRRSRSARKDQVPMCLLKLRIPAYEHVPAAGGVA